MHSLKDQVDSTMGDVYFTLVIAHTQSYIRFMILAQKVCVFDCVQ